ncbi:hypothetical protein RJ639_012521 [Escallonia herrerae]|uniref:TGS domain-containing protein n=1 Tax=Escallonia herrerae TaxID=1293975 RepID=A0AA88VLK0_9ASTE|nr:hypothetical protein RJ639_012521 [Escallonia herrerae]
MIIFGDCVFDMIIAQSFCLSVTNDDGIAHELQSLTFCVCVKDLEFMERKIEDLEKSMKRSNDKQLKIEHELCQKLGWEQSKSLSVFWKIIRNLYPNPNEGKPIWHAMRSIVNVTFFSESDPAYKFPILNSRKGIWSRSVELTGMENELSHWLLQCTVHSQIDRKHCEVPSHFLEIDVFEPSMDQRLPPWYNTIPHTIISSTLVLSKDGLWCGDPATWNALFRTIVSSMLVLSEDGLWYRDPAMWNALLFFLEADKSIFLFEGKFMNWQIFSKTDLEVAAEAYGECKADRSDSRVVVAVEFFGEGSIVLSEEANNVKAWLEEGKDVRLGDWKAAEIEILNAFQLLTAKPVVHLVNMNEKDYQRKKNKFLPKIHAWVQEHGGEPIIPFSCVLERNVADMPADEAAKYCDENKLQRKYNLDLLFNSALPKIIKTGFSAINLIYFFTAGPDEVKCWQIRRQSKAPQAAGAIHTDFERGFICAEVMKFDDLKELGSEAAVKAAGKYRQEGKTYVVQEGDIIYFKFNVSGGGKK